MKKWFLVLLILCASLTSISQDFSNKGKDFWLGYGFHVNMGAGVTGTAVNAQDMVLYFTSDKNANVTVEIPGVGYKQTFTPTGPFAGSNYSYYRIVVTGGTATLYELRLYSATRLA